MAFWTRLVTTWRDPPGVAEAGRGDPLVDVEGDGEALRLGERDRPRRHVVDDRAYVDGRPPQHGLARLEPGELQDLLHQVHEALAGAVHDPGEVLGLGRQVGVDQQLGRAHQRRQRRTDLVAHGGQEERLGGVGLLELAQDPLRLGDVLGHPVHTDDLVRDDHRDRRAADVDDLAVHTHDPCLDHLRIARHGPVEAVLDQVQVIGVDDLREVGPPHLLEAQPGHLQ